MCNKRDEDTNLNLLDSIIFWINDILAFMIALISLYVTYYVLYKPQDIVNNQILNNYIFKYWKKLVVIKIIVYSQKIYKLLKNTMIIL